MANETEEAAKRKWIKERIRLDRKGSCTDEIQIVDDGAFENKAESLKPKVVVKEK